MKIWEPQNPAVVDELTAMWKDGKSATEIAAVFDGATRNSVIGKIHRLGLGRPRRAARASLANPRVKKPRAIRAPKPRPVAAPRPAPKPAVVIDISHARPWIERSARQCAYLLDDDRACCAAIKPGSSYCAGHHSLIYRPTSSADDLARSLRKYA
ncbi:GcrA family cell cycle regulator [Brevundimonas sp.]|uniref:GcrA family cell cycle regulator n=1 Tax=Brevundimonas sp. TaxID=1871086 RepID=UPI0035AE4CAD